MKIFADFHHEHLYESLRLLFEKRLGWEMYRSIGLEWYEQKYWNVYNHPDTAKQYLSLNTGKVFRKLEEGERLGGDTLRTADNTEELRYCNFNAEEEQPGIYTVDTPVFPGIRYKACTLEAFKSIRFDVILCSIPQHIEPYKELIRLYQPQAKLIFQAGNNWPPPSGVENILSSSKICMSPKKHCVFYHQEFDLNLFKQPTEKDTAKSVTNMMHYLQEAPLFFELEKRLPDWTFKCYGAGNRDGSRGPDIKDIAAAFTNMGFLWHVKKEGDGYGFNLHHAAAMGVPMIVKKSHFKGQTAEDLLIDGVTCIDMDGKGTALTAKLLWEAAHEYSAWSDRVYNKFKEIVDFDKEEQEIRKFLDNLR